MVFSLCLVYYLVREPQRWYSPSVQFITWCGNPRDGILPLCLVYYLVWKPQRWYSPSVQFITWWGNPRDGILSLFSLLLGGGTLEMVFSLCLVYYLVREPQRQYSPSVQFITWCGNPTDGILPLFSLLAPPPDKTLLRICLTSSIKHLLETLKQNGSSNPFIYCEQRCFVVQKKTNDG